MSILDEKAGLITVAICFGCINWKFGRSLNWISLLIYLSHPSPNLQEIKKYKFWLTSIFDPHILTFKLKKLTKSKTRNSSGDEIANVNFLYDDIVLALKIQ